jgi:hypothetical protein
MTSRWKFGKIYILTNSVDDKTYIGSTCLNLCERMKGHKQQAKLLNSILHQHLNNVGLENVSITLIENYPCHSQIQLELRENEWIRELKPALNTVLPANNFRKYCKVPILKCQDIDKVKDMMSGLKQTAPQAQTCTDVTLIVEHDGIELAHTVDSDDMYIPPITYDTSEDYKQQYEILKVKYDSLLRLKDFYSSELTRVWNVLDKIVSK